MSKLHEWALVPGSIRVFFLQTVCQSLLSDRHSLGTFSVYFFKVKLWIIIWSFCADADGALGRYWQFSGLSE